MNIKELFASCPVEQVLSELMLLLTPDDDERNTVHDAYKRVLTRLAEIEPTASDYIVFGCNWLDDGKDSFDPVLYRKTELEQWLAQPSELTSITSIDALSDADIERLCHACYTPQSYGYELAPWAEILGYEVNADNAAAVGAAKLLASVLYEMTFCGLNETDIQAEREELKKRSNELDEIMKLPEEEQRKHLKTADEVFAELGFPRKEKTPEEEDAARSHLYHEVLNNKLRTYQLLKTFCTM